MAKYWLKNRLIYSIILALVLSVVVSIFFVKPNVETYGENRLNKGIYEYSEMDFDIPSPTKAQLTEIEGLDFVDDSFGYYYTESDLKISGKSVKSKLILSDDLESLSITMYNSKRLIEESSMVLSNPLYVDYDYAKKHSLSIGDTVYFNNIEFQVGRIYETNNYYSSAVFVLLVGAQKEYIESVTKSYSGAYLKVNDTTKADNYLRMYKPLGRLKSQDSFATLEEYQNHYNAWNNASYYNEITSFASKLSSIEEKSEISYYIGFAIFIAVSVVANIILSLRSSEKVYFAKKKTKKDSIKYYALTIIGDIILFAIALLLGVFVSSSFVAYYVPIAYITRIYVVAAVSTIIATVINLVYDIIFYKNKIKNA